MRAKSTGSSLLSDEGPILQRRYSLASSRVSVPFRAVLFHRSVGQPDVEILDSTTVVDVAQGAALCEACGQKEPPKRSAQVELGRVAAVGAAESLDASRNDAAVLGWADMPIHIMLSGPDAGSAGTKRQQR